MEAQQTSISADTLQLPRSQCWLVCKSTKLPTRHLCILGTDPLSTYIDAFTIEWAKLNFYAFPPFSLIQRCVQKIQMDQATGILVAPLWPTQTWFTPLLQLLHKPPWVFNQHPDKILSYPHYRTHPIPRLRLIVCPISGNPSIFEQKTSTKVQLSIGC